MTSSPASVPARPIVVLHSLAKPDGTTKYVDQMVQGAPEDVEPRCFSWREALRGRYDVLHLHWPELLLRAGSRSRRLAKRAAMVGLLARLALTRTPVVRTVHNVQPHETGDRLERRLLQRIDARTDLFVHLTPATPRIGPAPVVEIPHGHYRDRFARHPSAEVVSGRVLYAGIIRPYKGVDRLVALAPELEEAGAALRLVGNPSPDMRALVERAQREHPALSARLAFVPDADLVQEITSAELVVLPYREMHSSGVLLVVLSLARPAVVPRSAATEALADEVGPGWLHLYDGELTAATVLTALAAVRANRPAPPRLERRDWPAVGMAHREAYRMVIARKRAS